MPKTISLTEIYSPLATDAVSSPHHFLVLLGTDTVFTKGPIPAPKKDYVRGETLSFAAQTIVSILDEEAEFGLKDEPLSYFSPSVNVINGPTTFGSEVGDRIARGIFLTLQAAAKGKTSLQIIAHSRGAVEAILLMHEIDRIKLALDKEPDRSLKEILHDSPCNLTKTALMAFFPVTVGVDSDTKENRKKLLKRLNELTINPFLIDPVPGGAAYGVSGLAWNDKRFHLKPSCAEHVLAVYRDERTTCFEPLLPPGLDITTIPGHHGTGSGNQFTQQKTDLTVKGNTTCVQDLILFKLFNFLQKTTELFDKQTIKPDAAHKELHSVLSEFLASDDETREELLFKKYGQVCENDHVFRAFQKSSYSLVLGLNPGPGGARKLHGTGTLSSLNLEGIINLEHASLWLAKHVKFNRLQKARPDEQVLEITRMLKQIICEMSPPKSEAAAGAGTMIPIPKSTLFNFISTQVGGDLFFNALSMLVGSISQKYLNNHLFAGEKSRLMDVITSPFITLSEAIEITESDTIEDKKLAAELKTIVLRCQDVLQKGVKHTAESYYKSIGRQHEQLHQQIQLFLAPPTLFADAFDKFCKELIRQTTTTDLEIFGRTVLGNLMRIEPKTTGLINTAIETVLVNIGKNLYTSVPEVLKEKAIAVLTGVTNIHLDQHFEAHKHSIEDYLAQMEQLLESAKELSVAYRLLMPLAGTQTFNFKEYQLELQRQSLIQLAGTLLKEKAYNLRVRPAPVKVSETFYNLAKRQAIAFGAPSPEVEDLLAVQASRNAAELEAIKQAAKDLAAAIIQVKEEAATQAASHASEMTLLTTQAARRLDDEVARGELEIRALTEAHATKIASMTLATANQATEIERLTLAAGTQATEVERLTLAAGTQATEIERLTRAAGTQATEIERLTLAAGTQATEIERLTLAAGTQATEIERLTLAAGTQATEIERLTRAAGTQATEIERLTRATGTQATEIERLTLAAGTQATEIERLTLAAGTQATEIERLTRAAGTQATEVEGLTRAASSQATEVERLTRTAGTQATEVERLTRATGTQAIEIERLTRATGTQASEVERLTLAMRTQATEIERLTLAAGTQATEFERLTRAAGTHNTEIERLTRAAGIQAAELLTKQTAIDELTRQTAAQAPLIITLQRANEAKDIAIRDLKTKQTQLCSSNEITPAFLIQNKLIPLTTDYLKHLRIQARAYFPELMNEQELPVSAILAPEIRDAYDKIKIKFDKVQSLYNKLTDIEVILPSQRVANFKEALITSGNDLKLHRDPIWKAYFKSCLAVIAIIVTGVIPGVVGLAAYSYFTNRSPLFFSQSCGEKYVEEAELLANGSYLNINT